MVILVLDVILPQLSLLPCSVQLIIPGTTAWPFSPILGVRALAGIRASRLIIYRLPGSNIASSPLQLLLNLVFCFLRLFISETEISGGCVIGEFVLWSAVPSFVPASSESRLFGSERFEEGKLGGCIARLQCCLHHQLSGSRSVRSHCR